jgi:epoxyqueuosine reductase
MQYSSIQKKAHELGFDDVGITDAVIPEEDIAAYKEWIKKGHHSKLSYMENEIRCAPDRLLPGAKTAILFISYYKQPSLPFRKDAGLIASYARGRKYHNVHHSRLKKFVQWFEEQIGEKGICKSFSDSTPILEKALAVRAGLGWFGKNTLLIHRKFGTFTLLSGVLTTVDIKEKTLDLRLPRCGTCTRCLDSCPTGALESPYHLNAEKCLSNHLIESKTPLPSHIKERNPGYIFGCDICQDVCPHNMRKAPSNCKDFAPESGIGAYLTLEEIDELEKKPEKLFGTPLQRRGVEGLKQTAFHLFS